MALNWFKKLKRTANNDEPQNADTQNKEHLSSKSEGYLIQTDKHIAPDKDNDINDYPPVKSEDHNGQESTDNDSLSTHHLSTDSFNQQNNHEASTIASANISIEPKENEKKTNTHSNINPTRTQSKETNKSYLQRLKQSLSKTRSGFADLFFGKKILDQNLIDELEMQLLTADVGIEITEQIIQNVSEKISRNELENIDAVKAALFAHMQELLSTYAKPLVTELHQPFVILMTGINGAGKTTTIGKLAHFYKTQGKKVMLAAGDTFRAAAVEQLQTWGERNHVPVIAQATGSDSASVAYDALQSAIAKHIDVLIIDTAGRLHTQNHLMEELKKIKRVLKKLEVNAPHETILVIDAGNGQNALRQAEEFHKSITIDGVIITKLDGTAKGGILFAVTNKLHLPIRFIGVGEQQTDLRPFNATDFVNALLYSE